MEVEIKHVAPQGRTRQDINAEDTRGGGEGGG